MSDLLIELVRRAERLRDQAELLRQEIDQLRNDLQLLEAPIETHQRVPEPAKQSCLAAAITLAQDLGPDVASERPHEPADRGDNWFADQ